MGISLDFTGVQGGDFEPLPKGKYNATVFEVTEEESKAGKPYLSFQFKIQDEGFNNRRAFLNASLQPQALWNVKGILKNLGVEGLDGQFELDLDDLAGKPCQILIGHEVYEGETRDRVKKVLAPDPKFLGVDDVPELSDDDLPFSMDDDDEDDE